MLNFGPVYTFFKSEFLRNEHGDPSFFPFQSTRDMMSFVCAKFEKKSVRWKNLSYTSLNKKSLRRKKRRISLKGKKYIYYRKRSRDLKKRKGHVFVL